MIKSMSISSSLGLIRLALSGSASQVKVWRYEWASLVSLLRLWRFRQRQRRELAQLPDFMLKDIGVSRYEANAEASKPFWKN